MYTEAVTITIANVLGQQVFVKNYRNSKVFQLDFQEQAKGLYVVEINNANNEKTILKIVKQ